MKKSNRKRSKDPDEAFTSESKMFKAKRKAG